MAGAQWLCNTKVVQALFSLATEVLSEAADATDRLARSLTHTECEAVASIGIEQLAASVVFGSNVRTALLVLEEATRSASRRPEVCLNRPIEEHVTLSAIC